MKNRISKETVKKLTAFLKEAVEGLKNDEATCYKYPLACGLAIFVGWSRDFIPEDKNVIHDKVSPNYGICAGVKDASEYLWCDYEWLNPPADENGEIIVDDLVIAPSDDLSHVACWLLNDYFTALQYR